MVDSKWHGGKGSKTRPTDTTKYRDNYDAIFGKKNKEGVYSSTNQVDKQREVTDLNHDGNTVDYSENK